MSRLITTNEAAAEFGLPPGTIRGWKSRRLLYPAGLDANGRPLYRPEEIERLATSTRRRGRRMDEGSQA